MRRFAIIVPLASLLLVAAAPAGNLAVREADRYCAGDQPPEAILDRAEAEGWIRVDSPGGVLDMMDVKANPAIRVKTVDGGFLMLAVREMPARATPHGLARSQVCSVMDDSSMSADPGHALAVQFGRPGIDVGGGKLFWVFQDSGEGRRYLDAVENDTIDEALVSGPVTLVYTDENSTTHGVLYRRFWLERPAG